jgi:hypothetical protein
VEGAAHEPGLDKLLGFPKRRPNVVHRAIDPNTNLQLRSRHHLSLHPSDVANDPREIVLRLPAQEVMPCQPKREHL